MSYRKKLIEVALPLEAINAACKMEKNRKTGTIRNLHKWFAPMPAPAWRALLAATLLDDPGDPAERLELLKVLEELVSDDAALESRALRDVQSRIVAAFDGDPPLVADPFCGGGSTLVEAQRLGLRSFGSDLNPIAVLITKALVEIPPGVARSPRLVRDRSAMDLSSGPLDGFLKDTEAYAHRAYDEANATIGRMYPSGPDGDPVIAYRWARTVASPDPSLQGARTPLVTDWWMSKKPGELAWMSPLVDRDHRAIDFQVRTDGAPPAPSAGGAGYCLYSGAPIGFDYLQREGMAGRLGLAMFAFATSGVHGRRYFSPDPVQLAAADLESPEDRPRLDLPEGGLGFRVQPYGIRQWSQLFTPRQTIALGTFADLVAEVPGWVQADGGSEEYGAAIATVLGLCVGKLARSMSMLALWRTRRGPSKAESAFSRNDVPMTWDFAEINPFGGSVGDWLQIVETALRAFEFVDSTGPSARVVQADARHLDKFVSEPALIAADPPYFHYIGYGDLSNYFYIWERRALRHVYPDLFSTLRAPTSGELIADPSRHGGDARAASKYFTDGFTDTFAALRRVARPDLPILIVYAFKQQEARDGDGVATGWEAMLQALLDAGLEIVGTWPIHGTGSTRQRSQNSNTLATYVLLVCRSRRVDAVSLGTRREFQTTLKDALKEAVVHLKSAGISAVDLAHAAIGPGMAVFSRFSKVLEADGTPMRVRTALSLIDQMVDEIETEQLNEYDAATRWAMTWFDQYGLNEAAFGEAETLARQKNVSVDGLRRDGFLHAQRGVVRLLNREELDPDWDPTSDTRPTVWEMAQYLVRALDRSGEEGAAALLRVIGRGYGEAARDLAYRLYTTCERNNWAQEATAYDALVVAWPEITRLASKEATVAQGKLFDA